MDAGNTPQDMSEVDESVSTKWTPANDASPDTGSREPDAGSSEPSAKRKRTEKGRTRVSRACDRCKK
jgi:hypothetical protein